MRPTLSRIFSIVAIHLCLYFSMQAKHIIGGELTYRYVSANKYIITLKLFRDCNSGVAYDDPAYISVFDVNGNFLDTIKIPFPGSNTINPSLDNPCATLPGGLCVDEAIYIDTTTLPANTNGIYLVYQRCCRNNGILNIEVPGSTGVTYSAYIPPPGVAAINSNPYFNNTPPLVICADFPINIDMSATDPDGDSLVYSLYTPYDGANTLNPQPLVASPPPYFSDTVIWNTGYNMNNQIGGSPPLAINSKTGLLTGTACCIGLYVVGVCVKEYRHGVLLSETTRDFQFNITSCTPKVVAQFGSSLASAISANSDTITICGTYTVAFNNTSYGTLFNYFWNFGDPTTTTDTTSVINPTYTYPDTGYYHVYLYVNRSDLCRDSALRIINIRKGVLGGFSFDTACASVPTYFKDHSISYNYHSLTTWDWHFGDGDTSNIQNPAHTYTFGGTYPVILKVTDKFGCKGIDSGIVVVLAQPTVYLNFYDSVLCYKDSIYLSAAGGVTYTWQTNYHISNLNIANPIVWPRVDTAYIVRVVNKNGCISFDTSRVHVVDTVIAKIWHDTTVCQLSPVQLRDSGAFVYKWRPGASLSDSLISNPIARPDSTTLYYCYASIGSCKTIDTVLVHTKLIPTLNMGDSGTINQGEIFQMKATSSADTFLWTPNYMLSSNTLLDPVASPLNSTVYTLTVIGKDGCVNRDSLTVRVTHIHLLFMPNAFSPNGDGVNDTYQFFTEGIKELKDFRIFNRWGECVFQTNDLTHFWNGYYKGQPEPIGVFVYYIEAISFDGNTIKQKGNITLLK